MRSIGRLGIKRGMTRIITEEGAMVPVTVIEMLPNYVSQIKSDDTDGYDAVQLTSGELSKSKTNKSIVGHYAKTGVKPGSHTKEFRLSGEHTLADIKVGDQLSLDVFKVGQYVDVSGVTKGKGFAGVVKRHHFRTQDASHGNSLSHRTGGSIGQRQSPGKVFKGKRMAGHLGDVKRTVLSQKVMMIDHEKGLLLVRGAVPGANSGQVIVRLAVKKPQVEE